MNTEISITGLDKGAVLAALYNHSQPLGVGFLVADAAPMSAEEGAEHLKREMYVDYLKGRVIKTDFSGDTVDVRLYDRDNGQGAGARVIDELRGTTDGN